MPRKRNNRKDKNIDTTSTDNISLLPPWQWQAKDTMQGNKNFNFEPFCHAPKKSFARKTLALQMNMACWQARTILASGSLLGRFYATK